MASLLDIFHKENSIQVSGDEIIGPCICQLDDIQIAPLTLNEYLERLDKWLDKFFDVNTSRIINLLKE